MIKGTDSKEIEEMRKDLVKIINVQQDDINRSLKRLGKEQMEKEIKTQLWYNKDQTSSTALKKKIEQEFTDKVIKQQNLVSGIQWTLKLLNFSPPSTQSKSPESVNINYLDQLLSKSKKLVSLDP